MAEVEMLQPHLRLNHSQLREMLSELRSGKLRLPLRSDRKTDVSDGGDTLPRSGFMDSQGFQLGRITNPILPCEWLPSPTYISLQPNPACLFGRSDEVQSEKKIFYS